ncbi:hypothetical protein F2Q69_00058458 [Brassica cretica]|uniref:Uncharacterized protein n=1 Tax=Brassica cretica TaxID=69181 RepID=A0A8S9RNI2_BRACR|nr:hypothetical protein F2Q69_00058458 [Brassica cretica]
MEILFPDSSRRSPTFHLDYVLQISSRSGAPVRFRDSAVVDSWNPRTSPSPSLSR